MEDFFYAGGIRALLAQLEDELDLDCPTVNGRTLGQNIAGGEIYDAKVIHRRRTRSPRRRRQSSTATSPRTGR